MSSAEYERFRTAIMEQMAKVFEDGGHSPLVGRIYSLLMVSPAPISLQDIAEMLGVTKAAVSIQIRVLDRAGFCSKLPRGKDRKDYYCIPADQMQITMRNVMDRLQAELCWIEETLRKLPEGKGLLPEERESVAVVEQRYSELLLFYRVLFRRMDGLAEELRMLRNSDS